MKNPSLKIPSREKKLKNLSEKIGDFKSTFSIQKITGKEAQRLLSSLMDILPGTFYRCRINQKWTMEFLSPGCLKLTGYEPEELIENKKKAFGDIIHSEDLGSGWEKIKQAIKQKKPFQHTYRIITKDGKLKWVWEQGKAVYSTEGEPIALEGIITDITDFKLNEEAIRRLATENEIIANIGRIISSSLNIEEVYERFAEEAKKIINFDRISINLIDYEKNLVNVVYTTGTKVPGRQPGDTFPLNGSINQEVAQRRSSLIIQPEDEKEISTFTPIKQKPFLAGIRSQMAVPLFYQDKVIGILSFLSFKAKAYGAMDLRLGESIGTQIAGAIANAQLYKDQKIAENALRKSEEEARRLARNNALIAELGKIISSSLEIDEVYTLFAQQVRNVIPFNWLAITLVDKQKGIFYNPHTLGDDIPERTAGVIIPLAGSFTEEVIRRRSGALIQMESPEEILDKFPKLTPFLQRGFRSFLAVPLIHLDEAIGALHIYSREPKAYSENELILAESIASQIAGAIANAHLYLAHKKALEALRASEEKARRLAQENEIIANIGRIVTSSLNINKIYELFAEEVHKVISFNLIAITLIDHENGTFCPTYLAGAYVPGRTQSDVIALSGSFTEKVMRNKSGILLQVDNKKELLEHSPKLAPFWEQDFRSFIGVPLIYQDAVIAVLHIYSQKARAYSETDLRLAERIGSQIAGAIANAKLYTELQQALINLQNSEERYRILVENSPDMILLHDFKNYVYANPAALKTLGGTKEDLLGKPISAIIHRDSWEIVKKRLEQMQIGKSVPVLEEKYNTLDGRTIDVEVIASPVFYQGHQLVQVVARDISERKKAEREMARLQEQLWESQKMETVGRLAGGIAHDFNNLLTVIQGNCQLALLSLRENDPLKSNIADIQRASQRAAELTRQILAFGRRQILALKVINLNDTLKNMEKVIRRVMGEGIEILTSLQENIGKVKVDPGQIEHVLMNLAVNAKDAMPYGGKLILATENIDINDDFVREHPEMSPGRYIMLTVADTGVGMPPLVKERIFEPFFTTKEVGKGTGLGLSTVYGIIKQSGGNILVESEVGKGTTFKILLPQAEDLSEEEKPRTEQALPQMKETVLVVEDNRDVREIVVQVLKNQGYVVLEAQNGQEALSLGHKFKEKIDLLLTEVVMPQINGVDLARALSFLHPEIKVLYMSGSAEKEIFQRGLSIPRAELIQKPFTGEAITQKVKEILHK